MNDPNLRTVQDLFTLAIESGAYAECGFYMCVALSHLHGTHVITLEERARAVRSIRKLLNKYPTYSGFVSSTLTQSLAGTSRWAPDLKNEDTLSIYRNWAARHATIAQIKERRNAIC